MSTTRNVAVLVYPGVEVVDMNGPIDVFIKASSPTGTTYNVYTVAETPAPLPSQNGAVTITPGYTLDNCPPPSIVVIPGQIMPTDTLPPNPTGQQLYGQGSQAIFDWLNGQAANPDTRIMSVCIGAYILANSGLLNGKQATTHWGAIEEFQTDYPAIQMIENVRYVTDGQFVTTGGITAGIDGALALVADLDDLTTAQNVANVMVYTLNAPLPPGTLLPIQAS